MPVAAVGGMRQRQSLDLLDYLRRGHRVAVLRTFSKIYALAGLRVGYGFFPTELTAPLYNDEAMLQTLAAQTAIGRNGELSDIDGPAIFLAAPASDYITGQVIFVDGGFTAK